MEEGSQAPAEASSLGAGGKPSPPAVSSSRVLAAARDPVVIILLLAGVFDGLAGNLIHSVLLIAVGLALGREVALGRGGSSDVRGEHAGTLPITPLWPPVLAILAAVAYAVIIGGFGRYSWPATVAVVLPASIVLILTWREESYPRRDVPPLDPVGSIAWISAFVGLALWELAALLLQPSLTTDSQAHPTISVLTDPLLATHPGRSIALLLWLGLGWFILQR
jgi:hypothetical protein